MNTTTRRVELTIEKYGFCDESVEIVREVWDFVPSAGLAGGNLLRNGNDSVTVNPAPETRRGYFSARYARVRGIKSAFTFRFI